MLPAHGDLQLEVGIRGAAAGRALLGRDLEASIGAQRHVNRADTVRRRLKELQPVGAEEHAAAQRAGAAARKRRELDGTAGTHDHDRVSPPGHGRGAEREGLGTDQNGCGPLRHARSLPAGTTVA